MTQEEDTALIAAQLADLTGTVEAMAKELKAQQQRAETQQERIEIAAQELVARGGASAGRGERTPPVGLTVSEHRPSVGRRLAERRQ